MSGQKIFQQPTSFLNPTPSPSLHALPNRRRRKKEKKGRKRT